MQISDKKDVVIEGLNLKGEGIELLDCTRCIVRNCRIDGGGSVVLGILLQSCRNCIVEGCRISNTYNSEELPAHSIQFIRCVKCHMRRCTSIGKNGSVEDHYSLWDCLACGVWRCKAVGDGGSASGSGICIDGPKGRQASIRLNTLANAGQVGIVVVGQGHIVEGNTITGTTNQGIAVYMPPNYGKRKTANCLISNNAIKPQKGGDIWVDEETTEAIEVKS